VHHLGRRPVARPHRPACAGGSGAGGLWQAEPVGVRAANGVYGEAGGGAGTGAMIFLMRCMPGGIKPGFLCQQGIETVTSIKKSKNMRNDASICTGNSGKLCIVVGRILLKSVKYCTLLCIYYKWPEQSVL
jgi:hypothetical protein